jgi:phage-related tail protein
MTSFAEYKDQFLALGVIPSAPGYEAKALADLKADLDEEKAAWLATQVEADVLSRAVNDLKVSTDRFASQIPTLEVMVKHLEDKVVEGLKEVRARELCLECTTHAKENYQKEVAHLTKKMESKFLDWVKTSIILGLLLIVPTSTRRIRCRA